MESCDFGACSLQGTSIMILEIYIIQSLFGLEVINDLKFYLSCLGKLVYHSHFSFVKYLESGDTCHCEYSGEDNHDTSINRSLTSF